MYNRSDGLIILKKAFEYKFIIFCRVPRIVYRRFFNDKTDFEGNFFREIYGEIRRINNNATS